MPYSISVSCPSGFASPIHARLFFLCLHYCNTRRFGALFTGSFVLQSRIRSDTDLYHFLQSPITSPVVLRVLIVASCSSGFVLPVPACLDLLVLLFCSHNHTLRSVRIFLVFLQPLFSTSVSCFSFSRYLVLLALLLNKRTFRPVLTHLLLSKSRIRINSNHSHFRQNPIYTSFGLRFQLPNFSA